MCECEAIKEFDAPKRVRNGELSIVQCNDDKPALGRLFLLSLFMSNVVSGAPIIISGLLLIDIGVSFGYPVGVTGQIATAYSAITIVFALAVGVLSTRYQPKTLLTAGILLNTISALGSYYATSFPMLIIAYSLTGISSAIVFPMTATIIGDAFISERRSSALGWATAGNPFSVLFGSPTVSYIAGQFGWRSAFLFFMLSISIVGLALVYFGLPKTRARSDSSPRSASSLRTMLLASGVFVLLSRLKGSKNLLEDSGYKSLLRVATKSGLVGATPETTIAEQFDVNPSSIGPSGCPGTPSTGCHKHAFLGSPDAGIFLIEKKRGN